MTPKMEFYTTGGYSRTFHLFTTIAGTYKNHVPERGTLRIKNIQENVGYTTDFKIWYKKIKMFQ